MALGFDQQQIDDVMNMMASMPADELTKLLAEGQQGVDNDVLVDYTKTCLTQSKDGFKDRRKRWDQLWQAHECEIPEYSDKEPWQSKMVTNRPLVTEWQATGLVRRAVVDKQNFFDVEPKAKNDAIDKDKATFWLELLKHYCRTDNANMSVLFPDAAAMGFAVGTSMAMKPIWHAPEQRLDIEMIEPWNIHRDPDSRPRKPQSGLFCIHETYLDFHELRQGEQDGYYINIDKVKAGPEKSDSDERRKDARRRGQREEAHKFRHPVHVFDCYGDVLDENGEMVLPNARWTLANDVVIREAKPLRIAGVRWPIHQFAPLPSVLSFHGYGLYEGVLKMWRFQCNLLNLFLDNENWRINRIMEYDPSKLLNEEDAEIYPGALKKVKPGMNGAYLPIDMPSHMMDFQVLFDLSIKEWEEGSMVTEMIKGDIGQRRITAKEVEIKTQQSLGVFDTIGRNVEWGGIQAFTLIKAVLASQMDSFDIPEVAGVLHDNRTFALLQAPMMPQQREEILNLSANIKIEGVSILFEKAELISRVKALAQLTDNPRFAPYGKDLDIIARIASLMDEGALIKTVEEMKVEQQQQVQAQQALTSARETAGVDQLRITPGASVHGAQAGMAGQSPMPPTAQPLAQPTPTG